jgi:hypothetical protein
MKKIVGAIWELPANSIANPAQFEWKWAGLAELYLAGNSQTAPTMGAYISLIIYLRTPILPSVFDIQYLCYRWYGKSKHATSNSMFSGVPG